jgi:NAD+ synthase
MDAESVSRRLAAWIKEAVDGAGYRGVVLGLSGGLDSSVLAILCQQALPRDTLGLIMPCHSIPADKEHAEMVADKFTLTTKTIILDRIYDSTIETLPDFQPDAALVKLTRANLKARLRMIALYYTANQRQYLVAGSSNRSEITIGYFTKYGDSGVDMMPLGNLVKAEVREMAGYLGVPREIIDKPPSAGLWEGQTDEKDMGFSYEVLDNYILTGEAPDDIRKILESRKAASRHKCLMPPIPDQ